MEGPLEDLQRPTGPPRAEERTPTRGTAQGGHNSRRTPSAAPSPAHRQAALSAADIDTSGLTLRKALKRTWHVSAPETSKRPARVPPRPAGGSPSASSEAVASGPGAVGGGDGPDRARSDAARFLESLHADKEISSTEEADGVPRAGERWADRCRPCQPAGSREAPSQRPEPASLTATPDMKRRPANSGADVSGTDVPRNREPLAAGHWRPTRGPAGGEHEAPRALVLFSGPCTADTHLPGALADAGFHAEAVDVLIGGDSHDLTRDEVAADYVRSLRRGRFSLLALGTPCSSYSVLREPRIRSKRDPTGLATAPPEWLDTLLMHNQLADVTAAAIRAAHDSGTPWLLENPSDVSDPHTPWFWPAKADCASIFDQPAIREVLQLSEARLRAFAMCAFGTPWRKMTTIAFGGPLRAASEPLEQRGCPHGRAYHEVRLDEHDANGAKMATKASEYPPELCRELANYALAALPEVPPREQPGSTAALECGLGGGVAPGDVGLEEWSTIDGAVVDGELIVGGRMAHGRQLHPSLATLVARSRATPAAFASTRNCEAEAAAELRLDPMPAGLDIPDVQGHKARKRKKSRPLPRPERPVPGPAAGPAGPRASAAAITEPRAAEAGGVRERPAGPIAIEQLFLPGVYSERVESWFALADEAGRVLRRRLAGSYEPPPRVETRVIEQHEMQPFARGTVWDCANPRDCVPVERSTAETYIPGAKQLNRMGIRQMADELGIGRTDILDQACGGGIEVRSECELITVLAFHHPGLLHEMEAAQQAVEKSWQEQWTDTPVRHLPFVPCRLQPRDVVLQDRVRVRKGHFDSKGRPMVEAYTKARVTTNSSHGGADSVNAAIPEGERFVRLPRAQWHARALAIADMACHVRARTKGDPIGEEPFVGQKNLQLAMHAIPFDIGERHEVQDSTGAVRKLHAVAYMADAESAYNYCHVQSADQWQQCFVWWDSGGRAGACRDRRLPFGGASSPNRFQQISTLVTKYARKLQREFDEQHPLPWPVGVWADERREAQLRGRLPDGAEQLDPAYAHVYIDDAAGVAIDDPVPTPSSVADIHIADEPTRALGGEVPPRDARVLVHAKLLLLAMRMAGLDASPDKVLVGDPIITLGFLLSRADWRMRVPATKRAAMLASIAELSEEATNQATAPIRQAKRLLGRLTNVSQVLPELRQYLRGGFRAAEASWARRAGVRTPEKQQLRAGSLAHTEWLQLLQVAEGLLTANEGVSLAPRRIFPSAREGAVVSTTDASGDDGFGGYVFLPGGDPSDVWVVSEPWPDWALEARRRNDRLAAGKAGAAEEEFSVPAAELFAAWAVPRAALERCPRPAGTRILPNILPVSDPPVIAIGDCQPAINVINAAVSGEASMRNLLAVAREFTRTWLGVHVPRQANRDADGLSHPAGAESMVEGARKAGFNAHRVRVPDSYFDSLRAALGLGRLGREEKRAAPPRRG